MFYLLVGDRCAAHYIMRLASSRYPKVPAVVGEQDKIRRQQIRSHMAQGVVVPEVGSLQTAGALDL